MTPDIYGEPLPFSRLVGLFLVAELVVLDRTEDGEDVGDVTEDAGDVNGKSLVGVVFLSR